jgi:hypothetical protein
VSPIRCAYHETRDALYYCGRCGRAICPDCVVKTAAGNLCRRCVEAPPRARRAPHLWLWVAAGILLFLLLFGVLPRILR